MKNEQRGDMIELKNLTIEDVVAFNNDAHEGIILSWSANIGFGELTIYKSDGKWKADTECMCKGEDKEFIRKVFNKWIDNTEVEG